VGEDVEEENRLASATGKNNNKNSQQSIHTSELMSPALRCLISDSMSQVTADAVVASDREQVVQCFELAVQAVLNKKWISGISFDECACVCM
jgi:hypothetical protein